MSRREAYKDYVIDIIRESNDFWKAKVTRMVRIIDIDATVCSVRS
jgi:hypothetical protein